MRLDVWIWLCLLTLLMSVPTTSAAPERNYTCPVTTAPEPPFVPPAPYRAVPSQGFWYGTRDLWTLLPSSGIWRLDRTSAGYHNKLFLWREGYYWRNDPQPDIILVLNRLDSTAPMVASRGGTNAHFDNTWQMLTGITFPEQGCWQVTTHYAGRMLTFVISVQDQAEQIRLP